MRDLFVDRLQRRLIGHEPRDELLESEAEQAASGDSEEKDEESRRQRPAQRESSVKEDEEHREKAQPDVPLEPGRGAPSLQAGSFRRAPSRAAKMIRDVAATPKQSPCPEPPLGPAGAGRAE